MGYRAYANAPLGISLPGNVDSVASGAGQVIPTVPVGTVMKFVDDTRGEGEYIYLPGVASTAAGDCVEYSLLPSLPATIRHTNATASNTGRQVAIATAAVLAAQYGWYQISGVAIANVAAACAANAAVFGTGTAGVLDDGADAGDQILNAFFLSAIDTPSAGKAYVQISRPFVQGQIT